MSPYASLAVLMYDIHVKFITKEAGPCPNNCMDLGLHQKSKGLYYYIVYCKYTCKKAYYGCKWTICQCGLFVLWLSLE